MFIVIFVTSLVTLIVLIITSASYLISLISESDDANSTESLGLDTHDFSTTPTVSPGLLTSSINNLHFENLNHQDHHIHSYDQSSSTRPSIEQHDEITDQTNVQQTMLRDTNAPSSKGNVNKQQIDTAMKDIVRKEAQQQSLDTNSSQSATESKPPATAVSQRQATSEWNTSSNAQKNLLTSQLGPKASKQMFDDFDPKEVQFGGTGLHWCKTRKSLDKLVSLGLPLDILNMRHETALHVAIRRRKLQILIGLLCHGADVECRNRNGETPLILSCKANDIFACQLLLIFDANYDTTDNSGFSARHYAASICDRHKVQQKQLPSAAHLILAMLNEIGAKRCPERRRRRSDPESKVKPDPAPSTSLVCADGCSHSGSYNGNSYNSWPNYKKESLYKRSMFLDIIEDRKKQKLAELNRQKCSLESSRNNNANNTLNSDGRTDNRSRLLCIDGGGLRGVLVCQMMIEMEKYLKKPMMSYFDWVGGTSVGAFLLCALCTGTSLRKLRRITFDVKDEVFNGNKPYNSKSLERVLKRTFGATTRFSDVKDRRIAVTTVIADREPCQLRFFRNYKSPADILDSYGFSPDVFNNLSGHSVITRRHPTTQAGKSATTTETHNQQSQKAASSSLNLAQKQTVNITCRKEAASTSSSAKDKPNPTTKTVTGPAANKGASTHATQDDDKDDSESVDDDRGAKRAQVGKNDHLIDYVIDENDQDPLVWQAVRASGAAPFFFKPYGPYLDGGIISNNPTMDMLTEFHNNESVRSFLRNRLKDSYNQASTKIDGRLNRSSTIKTAKSIDLGIAAAKTITLGAQLAPIKEEFDFHKEPARHLDAVVSLGTGRGRVIGRQAMFDFGQVASGFASVFSPVELVKSIKAARDLFKKVMQQSCHTEDHIIDRAQAWCSSLRVPYFRINPALTTIFSIDDKRDEQLINALWQTKLYMRASSPQLEQLGYILDGPSCEDEAQSDVSSTSSASFVDQEAPSSTRSSRENSGP